MPSEELELQESTTSKPFDLGRHDQGCDDDDSSSASSSVELPPFSHTNHPEPFHSAGANEDDKVIVKEEEKCYSFILGKRYARQRDSDERVAMERSLFWFTYRAGFTEIEPYGYTSDAGWGCMVRIVVSSSFSSC